MVLFGPSGCGEEFYNEGFKDIFQVPKWLKNKGLDAYEYSFGHGYQMNLQTAEKAGRLFKENNIETSIHAPFYINFANPDEEMFLKTKSYIYTGIKFLNAFRSKKLVFHAASCGKMKREEALKLTEKRFIETFDSLESDGLLNGLYLCPETMGKSLQIGTYKEIIQLCKLNKHLIPTFDFGHINALEQGSLKSEDDYKKVFDYSLDVLGFDKTNNCHIHFSKIQYGPKGEIKHLNFDDNIFGPNFEPLAKVLIDYKLSPTVICESMSLMPHDARIMKKIYNNLLDKS